MVVNTINAITSTIMSATSIRSILCFNKSSEVRAKIIDAANETAAKTASLQVITAFSTKLVLDLINSLSLQTLYCAFKKFLNSISMPFFLIYRHYVEYLALGPVASLGYYM
jgi:hypothetical protein